MLIGATNVGAVCGYILRCCFYYCCCAYSANVIGGARDFCYLGKANHHPQKKLIPRQAVLGGLVLSFFIGVWVFR